MTWNKPVFSRMVKQIGYDSETKELLVYWHTGRVSAYAGVDEAKAWEVSNAASVGDLVNNEIKPNFSHKYRR